MPIVSQEERKQAELVRDELENVEQENTFVVSRNASGRAASMASSKTLTNRDFSSRQTQSQPPLSLNSSTNNAAGDSDEAFGESLMQVDRRSRDML